MTGTANSTVLPVIRDNSQIIKQDLERRSSDINTKILKLSNMFENFDTPVGTIPVGFQRARRLIPIHHFNFIIIFRLLCFSSYGRKTDDFEKSIIYIERLLYDPINKEKKSQKLQFGLILIPILIFALSIFINILIYVIYDEPNSEADDPFRAAVTLNKVIYIAMFLFAIFFVFLSIKRLFFSSHLGRKTYFTPIFKSDGPPIKINKSKDAVYYSKRLVSL